MVVVQTDFSVVRIRPKTLALYKTKRDKQRLTRLVALLSEHKWLQGRELKAF
jgi:hypothetical protein